MAKDIYHNAVRHALEGEGWTITHDPYAFRVGGVRLNIDMGAEKVIGAEKEGRKIAIEVKSFVAQSDIYKFHEAMGQYDSYWFALEDYEPDRVLYLAIPDYAYDGFFQLPLIQKVIQRKKIQLIIYEPITETIISWINY
jgi:XisH protein